MICRMCLLDSADVLNIFDGDSTSFSIVSTIAQHFWFEPKEDDPISNIICNACWWQIENFHIFYTSVEDAHRKLSERYSVKQETHHAQHSDAGIQVLFKVEENGALQPELGQLKDVGAMEEQVGSGVEEDGVEEDGVGEVGEGEAGVGKDAEEEDADEMTTLIEVDEEPIEDDEDCSYDGQCDAFEDVNVEHNESEDDEKSVEMKIIVEPQTDGVPRITRRSKYLEAQKNLEEFIKIELPEEKLNASDMEPSTTVTRTKRTRRKKQEVTIKMLKPTTEYLRKSKEDDAKIAMNMKLKCEYCNTDYPTFAEVKKHYRTVHRRKGYVVCCNKKLYKRILVLDHINKHLNPDYFKCVECNKIFADKQCLKNHMVRHESDDLKTFRCEHCPRRYAKQYLLDQHKLIHTPQEERQYFCEECGKAFPTNNLMQTHRRYVHENAYGQMCHICAKVIRGKALFAKHQLEHAGVTEPKVQCNRCGAWLKHEYSLKKHMARHNESRNENICSICGKKAPSKGALRSHVRYVHSAKRSFECSVCNKGFKKAIVLREHMTTHTGEVLYTCPHCPKTFNSSANMHSHRKKAHRQEWEEGRKNRGIAPEMFSSSGKCDDEKNLVVTCESSVENLNDSAVVLCESNVTCDTNI